MHQLALRADRHVRFPEGHLLLLPGVVERQAGAASVSALELVRQGGPGDRGGCFTNLDRVELFVNGASAGAQEVKRNSHVVWKVPYAPGAIEARGYKGTTVALTERRETTGAPARIVLK